MPAFKTDSSFFNKIAMGAVGSRATRVHLESLGHKVIELERGSLDAKIWKDVKRKRVRIPDLVCQCCGQRIEVRAKSEPRVAMSHSPSVPERKWDYGMVGGDWIAFPICEHSEGARQLANEWTRGILYGNTAYWSQKEWIRWAAKGTINYFTVDSLRRVRPKEIARKGAEEGAEATLLWRSCFSPIEGRIEPATAATIKITAEDGSKRASRKELRALVKPGDVVALNQIIACNARPRLETELRCAADLDERRINEMLGAPQLPVRFAALKLARARGFRDARTVAERISQDSDEDIYVRLEAAAYLCAVHGHAVADLFGEALTAQDKPDQLEAAIALGEVGTESAAHMLADILEDSSHDYFLRSAAAFCLGRLSQYQAAQKSLVRAFGAQSHKVREDALAALADAGFGALAEVMSGIGAHSPEDIQAGCAEVVRLLAHRANPDKVSAEIAPRIAFELSSADRTAMSVWLGGQLPEQIMRPAMGALLDRDSRLAYALTVAWAHARSWIAPLHDGFIQPSRL